MNTLRGEVFIKIKGGTGSSRREGKPVRRGWGGRGGGGGGGGGEGREREGGGGKGRRRKREGNESGGAEEGVLEEKQVSGMK